MKRKNREEHADESTTALSPIEALVKTSSGSKQALSKKQLQLKQLTAKAESLKIDIKEESKKLELLMELFTKELLPQYARIAEEKIKLAKVLSRATIRIRFSSRYLDAIGEAIVALCEEAFEEVDITEDLELFYNKWAASSYREKANEQLKNAKALFADMMRERYDVDIDVEDIEDTTEGFAQFRQRMKEQIEQDREQFWSEKQHKSARQRKQEAAQKAEKEMALRSIRSIYIALVKVVHPDGEQDINLKKEKEEVMKKVALAYEQQDLETLLALEAEWIYQAKDNLQRLTDEKLSVYLTVLRQQVCDLEREKLDLVHSPRYEAVAYFSSMPANIAINRIKKMKRDLRDYCARFTALSAALSHPEAKQTIMDFVVGYNKEKERAADDEWSSILI